nr:30S ribosomal protein S2 [Rubrobacter sp.]
ELLQAGVHFGHQAKRWNPKMKRYIFAQRTGVHIIDLDQTITLLEQAMKFVRGVAEADREVLFVGTKKQAQIPLAEQAIRSGQPYVAERYIGGMLTNFQTILPRIQYFTELARRVEETPEEEKTGKDWFALNREYQKLRRNFAGLTEMEKLPGAVFVVDPKREELMVKEANRLKIPVVALTDTNCDPEVIDYVIPGNDDAIRAIGLISRLMADVIVEARGEEVAVEDRPLPPVIEEALATEEQPLSEAAEDAKISEPAANGNGAANGQPEPVAEEPADDATAEAAAEEPADDAATEDPPANGAEPVVEEAPVEEAPVEEAPVEEASVEEASVEEASVDAVVVDEGSAEEVVAEEAAAEEAAAADGAGQENRENEEN